MHTSHDARDWANVIIVALDVETLEEAEKLLDELAGFDVWIKVGNQLGTEIGWEKAINTVHKRGFSIFCDTKFKDIPETVKKSSKALAQFDPDMFNIMADTSPAVLEAAVVGAKSHSNGRDPLLLGVTVLTSISDTESYDIYGAAAKEKVIQFATNAAKAGLDGVVCSSEEVAILKSNPATSDLQLVVPGIRPRWATKNDQSRVMTPRAAIEAGADFIVIGRPITQPPAEIGSPRIAVEKIIEELEGK